MSREQKPAAFKKIKTFPRTFSEIINKIAYQDLINR